MKKITYTYDGDLGIPGVDKKDFFSQNPDFPHVRILGRGLEKNLTGESLNRDKDWYDFLVMEDIITESVARRVLGMVIGRNNELEIKPC